jgi:hypothetical protein
MAPRPLTGRLARYMGWVVRAPLLKIIRCRAVTFSGTCNVPFPDSIAVPWQEHDRYIDSENCYHNSDATTLGSD